MRLTDEQLERLLRATDTGEPIPGNNAQEQELADDPVGYEEDMRAPQMLAYVMLFGCGCLLAFSIGFVAHLLWR